MSNAINNIFKSKRNDSSVYNKYFQEPYKHNFHKFTYYGLLTKHHNLNGLTDSGNLELNNGKNFCLSSNINIKGFIWQKQMPNHE